MKTKTKQNKSKDKDDEKILNKDNRDVKENEEVYYEIETILAHKKKKTKNGKFDHLIKIKWKGYKKTEWWDEDMLREDVSEELDKYFKENEKLTKNVKRGKTKTKTVDKPKILKCKMNHKLSSSFRKTENSWEVSKVKCNGNCGKNYTNETCNVKILFGFVKETKIIVIAVFYFAINVL